MAYRFANQMFCTVCIPFQFKMFFLLKVADVDLPFDKMKNQRRAFCFITFETEEAVDAVCVTQKQDINGRQVGYRHTCWISFTAH